MTHRSVRRLLAGYFAFLAAVAVFLGLLHRLFLDLKAGGVYWFNLDKERNLPTWFSGMLFFLFGCAAFLAYYWERKRNGDGEPCFRLPGLWVGVGLLGLALSLDEMTALHENLLWLEVRQVSARLGGAWVYATQWQVLFSPAILLALAYLVLFFANRLGANAGARRCASAGIALWIGALCLEGMRGAFRLSGGEWYDLEVLVEEELEMLGSVCLVAAITLHVLDLALDFSADRREQLRAASGFANRRSLTALTVVVVAFSLCAGALYLCAQRQAAMRAPVPELFHKMRQSDRPGTPDRRSPSGRESTRFEETYRSMVRRGRETLAERGHGQVRPDGCPARPWAGRACRRPLRARRRWSSIPSRRAAAAVSKETANVNVKRVLVTGGAGYIGSVLVRQLLERGHSVCALDALLFGDHALRDVYGRPGFDFLHADVRNPESYASALADAQAVVHLAAIVGDAAAAKSPRLTHETNLVGSEALFQRAQDAPDVRRFVFVSTCSNYGRMEGVEYCSEESPLKPLSLYAETKVEFEGRLLNSDTRGDFVPTALRFATAYGLSPRMRFDLTVNEFTREAALGRELLIYGEQFWRPYCHVHDLARACLCVLESAPSKVDHEVFNVGDTAENYTKKQLAELLLEFRPQARIRYVTREEDPRDYKVRFDKIRDILGFEIARNVGDGIAEILEALASGAFPDPEADRYRNS